VCGCPTLVALFWRQGGYWQLLLTTDNCFSIDTNGQERRARRFLPYKQSMVLLGNAVKLRK
jgi:hypothetical protein